MSEDKIKTPILDSYMERIGAVKLNFKTWMVKENVGKYYVEKAVLKIDSKLGITCNDENYLPSKIENKEIIKEINENKFPESIEATKSQFLAFVEDLKNDGCYPIFNRRTSLIYMVQVRINVDGGKIYVPWCLFSDNKWRPMEPEGKLKFYKPEIPTGKKLLMIHEGAKAAKAASEIKEDHPWYEDLINYEHWGILGGALAPHRSDYSELVNFNPDDLIYICDNDWHGQTMLQNFSRNYGRKMKGLFFTSQFPKSFDLAENMPESLMNEGKWVGPSLNSLCKPATLATFKTISTEGQKKKEIVALSNYFAEEWKHTVKNSLYIHKEYPNRIYSETEFDNLVRPFSDVQTTSNLLKKSDASKVADMDYRPDLPSGIYEGPKGFYINTFVKSEVKIIKGDYTPFEKYLDLIFPLKEDCEHVKKWCATLISCPHIRMTYSLLLVSDKQGVGKGTLAEKILAPLVGIDNTSFPTEREITSGTYNPWASRKRLAVIHEIYAGDNSKAYNILKTYITDDKIEVNEKFLRQYYISNWLHCVACSNSMNALKMDNEDRRWLVPKLTDLHQSKEFWFNFNNWLTKENGLNYIAFWAREYVEKNGHVLKGEHAPSTEYKGEAIEAGWTPIQYKFAQALKNAQEDNNRPVFFVKEFLIDEVKNSIFGESQSLYKNNTSYGEFNKVMRTLGWKNGKRGPCVEWNLGKNSGTIISNSETILSLTPKELYDKGFSPLNPQKYV